MNRILSFVLFTLLSVLALGGSMPTAHADLKIVATVPDLAAIAKEIAGDKATVTALALPTQDPHFVDARPSLALRLAQADVLMVVGLELEIGWLPTLQTGSRNRKIQTGSRGYFNASQFVEKREVPQGRVDRSMGDVHPGGNPHYLYDPRNGLRVGRALGARLAELDPDNAGFYRTRTERFATQLTALLARLTELAKPLRGQAALGYHKSWVYLADWLGLRIVEHIEPRPGVAPSPAHVTRVIGIAKAQHVKIILQEAFYPDRIALQIATQTGASVALLPAGANFASNETYGQKTERMLQAVLHAWSHQ